MRVTKTPLNIHYPLIQGSMLIVPHPLDFMREQLEPLELLMMEAMMETLGNVQFLAI